MTATVLLKKKHKGKGDIEFAPVYVNCTWNSD